MGKTSLNIAEQTQSKKEISGSSYAKKYSVGSAIKSVAVQNKGALIMTMAVIVLSAIIALYHPIILGRAIDGLTNGKNIIALSIWYVVLIALSGFISSFQNVMITRLGEKVTHGLRSECSRKLSNLPASYYTSHPSGETTSIFVNDIDKVDTLFTDGVVSMFANALQIISVLIVIFTKSLGLGILLLIMLPLLFLLTRFFQKRSLSAQIKNRVAVGKVNSTLPETIENGRMIKNLHAENFMERRYDRFIRDSFEATDRIIIYDSVYSPIIKTMAAVAIGIMMASAASGTSLAVLFGIGVGTAVTFMAYVNNIFEPLSDIGMEIQTIQAAGAGVRRIGEFLNYEGEKSEIICAVPDEEKTEVVCANLDKAESTLTNNKENSMNLASRNQNAGNKTGFTINEDNTDSKDKLSVEKFETDKNIIGSVPAVTFSHVTFGYDPSKIILKDFSLEVMDGEHVTLVGRTGAGKSTTFNLMNGLYLPQEGKVQIFGADASNIKPHERRKLITTVTQDFTEVEGNLRDQISLGDKNISDDDIEKAVAIAGLKSTITELPQGLDTPFKDVTFSMGERSLLGIARAVASNPKILLLDEITANLDTNTEEMIMIAIEKAAKNRTVISISHRLSAALDFDRIVEI